MATSGLEWLGTLEKYLEGNTMATDNQLLTKNVEGNLKIMVKHSVAKMLLLYSSLGWSSFWTAKGLPPPQLLGMSKLLGCSGEWAVQASQPKGQGQDTEAETGRGSLQTPASAEGAVQGVVAAHQVPLEGHELDNPAVA